MLLTPKQVADELWLHLNTVYLHFKAGSLPAFLLEEENDPSSDGVDRTHTPG